MSYSHPQQGSAAEAAALRKKAGEHLKNLRMAVEKTQRDVANDCGFEYYTMISQIEAGRTRVPPQQLVAYAKSLKVSPKKLVKDLMQWYDPVTFEILFTNKWER